MALLTGKTIDIDHVGLIPGLVDTLGSLRYSCCFPPFLLRLDGRL